jgi:hypothetical protein
MRNFHRTLQGVNTIPLLHAIVRQPELWNQNTFRTKYTGTPHGDVDDIWLRFSDVDKVKDLTDVSQVIDDPGSVWYPAVAKLPQAKALVLDLMRLVDGHQLERLLVTRMKPGSKIARHADAGGVYVEQGNIGRYHVVLQGLPGSMFICGNEQVCMLTGEVWWFNAHQEHEVINNSADDRIHLLMDVKYWP